MASPGERIGSYKIVDALGAGGMGEVYRAHDSRLGRDVALKVLREEARFEPERRVRFEREARAAAGLSHPNIVSVFDIGEYDGCLYIVSELIAGDTLLSLLRDGPLATRKLLEIGVQIADGTQFALTVEPGKLSVVGTGGQASPVRIAGYDGFMPDWSPDGRWIAASGGDYWFLVSPDGQRKIALPKIHSASLGFSEDRRRVYGIRTDTGIPMLFYLEVANPDKVHDVREIDPVLMPGSPVNPGVRFSVAPDGKSAVFGTFRRHTAIRLLEHFEPPPLLERLGLRPRPDDADLR